MDHFPAGITGILPLSRIRAALRERSGLLVTIANKMGLHRHTDAEKKHLGMEEAD
jgi:hypothetical protein